MELHGIDAGPSKSAARLFGFRRLTSQNTFQRCTQLFIKSGSPTNKESRYVAIAIDDHGLWDCRRAVAFGNPAVEVEDHRGGLLETVECRFGFFCRFFQIHRIEFDTLLGKFMNHLIDLRHHLQAGATP